MAFKFPPKEILEKALDMLSEKDKNDLREQYLRNKEKTKKYWRQKKEKDFSELINSLKVDRVSVKYKDFYDSNVDKAKINKITRENSDANMLFTSKITKATDKTQVIDHRISQNLTEEVTFNYKDHSKAA